MQFLEELKKRRVIRTAVIYIGAAFAALQAVELLVDALNLSDNLLTIAAFVSMVGLPVALVLSWAFDVGDDDSSKSSEPEGWLSLRTVLAGLALLGAGVLLGFTPQFFSATDDSDSEATVRRYEILLPEEAPIEFVGSSPLRTPVMAFTITPDGNKLVYAGPSETDITKLYVRRLDEFGVQPLEGTEGAYRPFVSPNGKQIAFFAHDELRVVPIDGGSVSTVIAAPNPRGGVWLSDDRILYRDREGTQAWTIDLNPVNSAPVRIDEPATPSGASFNLLSVMSPTPNGKGVITNTFPISERSPALVVWEPDSGEITELIQRPVFGQAVDGGLVYSVANDLMAVDYDADSMEVSGEPRRVGTELRRDGALPQYVLSQDTLIYATGAPYGELRVSRITPDWQVEDSVVEPARFAALTISPDGKRLAIAKDNSGTTDIWVYSLEDGNARRLTRGGNNQYPMWSDDGDTIFFIHSGTDDTPGIYFTSSTSATFEKTFVFQTFRLLLDVHPGDLGITAVSNGEDEDIVLVNLQTGEQNVVAGTVGVQDDLANLSPDQEWVAYTADASGRYEIVVSPIDERSQPVQVSIAGGEEPRWSPDMTELHYRYGTRMFSSRIERDGDRLTFGTPEVVFEDPQWVNVPGYSFWPDRANGGYYIMRENQPPTTRSLRVVEGWQAANR